MILQSNVALMYYMDALNMLAPEMHSVGKELAEAEDLHSSFIPMWFKMNALHMRKKMSRVNSQET